MECNHSFAPELVRKPDVAFCEYCGEKKILSTTEEWTSWPQEWVSVNDRLPGSHEMVLMAAPTAYCGYKGVIYGWWASEKFTWMTSMRGGDVMVKDQTADGQDPVTHWMPMPKLPKEI